MEQLEKVRKGLECCIASNDSYCPDECPYKNICLARKGTQHIYVHLFEDALALINAQQERIKELEAWQTARVMTLEEWGNAPEPLDGECMCYEIKNNGLKAMLVKAFKGCKELYGKSFRCWTQRPTDEQMEAAKWE